MSDHQVLFVGIIGFSGAKFDEVKAREIISNRFQKLKEEYVDSQQKRIKIVSGWTNLGIPKIAYEGLTSKTLITLQEARKNKFHCVGVASAKAKDYECFPCDEVHVVGDEWGEESPTFLKMIDLLIKVGGGEQSRKEYAAFSGIKEEYPLEAK